MCSWEYTASLAGQLMAASGGLSDKLLLKNVGAQVITLMHQVCGRRLVLNYMVRTISSIFCSLFSENRSEHVHERLIGRTRVKVKDNQVFHMHGQLWMYTSMLVYPCYNIYMISCCLPLYCIYILRPVRIDGRASNKEVVVRSLHANLPMF